MLSHLSRRFSTLPLALALAVASSGRATEGGTGHYVPGTAATLIDLAPTKPGLIAEGMYLHYEGDASANLSVAGLISAGLDVESDVATFGLLYTLDRTVMGAHYTFGAFIPYIWMTAEARVDTVMGRFQRRDTDSGVGDLSLIPAMLAWKIGDWQLNGIFAIYAPTGEYQMGRLANEGLNYWTFQPTVGASYNNEKVGFNAALYGGFSANTENDETDYLSGAMFHLEASVQQLLPAGPGFLGVGAEFFWLQQITPDEGDGARLGDFEGHTLGVGPVLTYVLPCGGHTFVTEARWLPELDVRRRLEGDYVWVKAVFQY